MRRRFPHKLRSNKGRSIPVRWVFYDCETYQRRTPEGDVELPFRLATSILWTREVGHTKEKIERKTWYDRGEFVDYLLSNVYSKTALSVMAHNLNADFIMANILPMMKDRGWVLGDFYLKGRTKMLRLGEPTEKYAKHRLDHPTIPKFIGTKWRRRIKFTDLANYFPEKLETIGESLGYPKASIDFQTCTETELAAYCMRDTEIVYMAMRELIAWWIAEDLGTFGSTAPSLAFNAYRHRFMESDIYIHANEKVVALSYRGYHGGRCEVFRQGTFTDGPYYKLDINAAYPFVMGKYDYPIKMRGYTRAGSIQLLRSWLSESAVVADVTLRIKVPRYPVKVKGRTVHPLGVCKTTLTTELLNVALVNDEILAVGAMARYDRAPIFKGFVAYVYDHETACKVTIRRLKAMAMDRDLTHEEITDLQDAERKRKFYKLLRNSLYGKFGQHQTVTEHKGPLIEDRPIEQVYFDDDPRENHTTYVLAGEVYWVKQGGASLNAFPAIAAHVTDNLRLMLWRVMGQAGMKNVFYTDTDGFWVNAEGYDRLKDRIDPLKMGMLKIEATTQTLRINAPKDYETDKGKTIKGVRKDATWITDDIVEQDKWPGLLTSLRTDRPDLVIVTKQRKHLRRTIRHGRVLEGGWVVPFVLPYDLWQGQTIIEEYERLDHHLVALSETMRLPEQYVDDRYDFDREIMRASHTPEGRVCAWPFGEMLADVTRFGAENVAALGEWVLADAVTRSKLMIVRGRLNALESLIPEDIAQEVMEIEAEQESLVIPPGLTQRDVFKLWDYRKGTWRRAKNANGQIVDHAYGPADKMAAEAGYADLRALKQGVMEYLEIMARRRELVERRARLEETTLFDHAPDDWVDLTTRRLRVDLPRDAGLALN